MTAFDGSKGSCREGLAEHNARRRKDPAPPSAACQVGAGVLQLLGVGCGGCALVASQ